jgi:hypothetical protein
MESIKKFPSYLGFGKLKTINDSLVSIKADYFFLDKAVHRINYFKEDENWLLEDIYDSKGFVTYSLKFEQLATMHFNRLDCNTSSIFKHVLQKVCNLGNVYFEYLPSLNDKKKTVISSHPAGRMLVFRLPVILGDEMDEKANIIKNEPLFLEKEKVLTLYDAYKTSILIIRKDGQKRVEPILMFEYIVPLAYVYDLAQWIYSHHLIRKEKIYRMIIQDAINKKDHAVHTFTGTSDDEYITCTFLYKGLEDKRMKFTDFEKIAIDSFYLN